VTGADTTAAGAPPAADRPLTEVAAAVLLRGAGREFLLAQRPPGKVYAGYWEFPGGKVEPGETAREALVRELDEELGIAVAEATPWLTREFDYPHARVRLHFFRIDRWQGAIAPIEHSGFAWCRTHETPAVAPILPANAPILAALDLPPRYAITCAAENGADAEIERLERALAGGLRLVQLRDKDLPPAARATLARRVVDAARPFGARVLINDDAALAEDVAAAGLHLSSARLMAATMRPPFALVGASCHDAGELAQAARLGLDYALLGPVLPTATHAGATPLGWAGFARLAAGQPLPIYALGGMRNGLLDEAMRHGAHGIALMRGW
jgi:8-oxo-dGTP diphosphatase